MWLVACVWMCLGGWCVCVGACVCVCLCVLVCVCVCVRVSVCACVRLSTQVNVVASVMVYLYSCRTTVPATYTYPHVPLVKMVRL